MSKEKKFIIASVVGVIVFIALVSTMSYAYFTRAMEVKGDGSVNVTTANLSIDYQDNDKGAIDVTMIPGDKFSKSFSVTNNGDTISFQIYVDELVNEFTSYEDITYEIFEEGSKIGKSEVFPHLASANNLGTPISISKGATKNYKVTITYNNTDASQIPDMGKKISGKIFIK